uniref:Uncharacterized protein n=1 Tax=Prevotella sp. GTC17254 TaxID=3236794 RepID=A0AB33IW75_9BACT
MSNAKILDKETTKNNCKNYEIRVSAELLELLCCDYTFKNTKRFSRIQAFQNLIERYCTAEMKQEDMAVNMERLSKSWGWSRPSVMRFVQNLEAMNVLEVFSVVTSKMVRLRKDILIFAPEKNVGE